MDGEIHRGIQGAYSFARNVLVVVMAELMDQGTSNERIEKMLKRLDEANQANDDPHARQLAEIHTAGVNAMFLKAVRKENGRPES